METVRKKRGPKIKPVNREKYGTKNRLQEFRMAERPGRPNGYTQEELAEYLGVALTTVVNAERYGRSLGKRNWYRLADLFDCDPRVLEGHVAEKTSTPT